MSLRLRARNGFIGSAQGVSKMRLTGVQNRDRQLKMENGKPGNDLTQRRKRRKGTRENLFTTELTEDTEVKA